MKRIERYTARRFTGHQDGHVRQVQQRGSRHAARRLQRERRPTRTLRGYAFGRMRQAREALQAHTRGAAVVAALTILLLAIGVGAGIFGIFGAWHTPTANAHAQTAQRDQQWRLTFAGTGNLPTMSRWVDPTRRTALTLHGYNAGSPVFIADQNGKLALNSQDGTQQFIFALTLPDGGQIVGVALAQSGPSGQLLLSTNSYIYDPTTGQLTPTPAANSSICDAGELIGAGGRSPIEYALRARFSPDGLSAYAELAYAPLGGRIFSAQVGPSAAAGGACQGNASLAAIPGAVVLQSGCPALAPDGSTTGDCVDALGIAPQSVTTFDQAVAAQNWSQVYKLCAPDITGQYTEAQLATILGGHSTEVGRIPASSVPSNAPHIQFTVGGEAFFAVDQQATLAQNGSTASRSISSYYLFEGGQWLFWFSK